ncbi:OmpA family protein [Tropicimonas sp. TH_r6]|uniref:OmpA family protein n=1 Tax=Tropicimonas sp. TH_r6 TaxID=3082085 RepID=UPI0029550A28|nr:OmpA family protein [Tropicimonas sp. TH_r6]MDV7143102.1 OmpA family protein [Tropicimonas sp. TH_r6]
MSRKIITVTASVIAVFGLTFPVLAQGVDASQKSAQELQQLFEEQKTRGLVIAPASNGGGSTQASSEAAVTSEPATTQAAVYTPVAAGTEINILISFDFDSALLRENEKPKLTALCEAMQNMEEEVFRIVGHTDSKGSESYNSNLSMLRASEVKRFLVGSCGIAEDRLIAIGAGEEHPVNASDPTADENRRVEFQLIS